MTHLFKFDLYDGQLLVTIGNVITLTEEQWLNLTRACDAFMEPVWQKREDERKAAEIAAWDAEAAQWQRVETICGRQFRIQRHVLAEAHHEVCAWLDGYTKDDAPFLIQVRDIDSKKPWTVEGRLMNNTWGRMTRPELADKRGGVIRFASIAAAAKKALALEAGVPAPDDGIPMRNMHDFDKL